MERFPHPYKKTRLLCKGFHTLIKKTRLLWKCKGFHTLIKKTRLLWKGFHTLITNVLLSNRCGISQSTSLRSLLSSLALISIFNRCGISQSTPLQGLTSSLVHHSVSGFDTISNSPNSLLAYIVFFRLVLLGFPSNYFKTRLLGRDFYTLINNASFPSPTDAGSHNKYNEPCPRSRT